MLWQYMQKTGEFGSWTLWHPWDKFSFFLVVSSCNNMLNLILVKYVCVYTYQVYICLHFAFPGVCFLCLQFQGKVWFTKRDEEWTLSFFSKSLRNTHIPSSRFWYSHYEAITWYLFHRGLWLLLYSSLVLELFRAIGFMTGLVAYMFLGIYPFLLNYRTVDK